MAATNLRFVILGDDRASSAFNKFARSVNDANKAVDRNNAALGRSGKASAAAEGSMAGLASSILGVGDASKLTTGKMETFSKVLAGVNLATGILEPAAASLTVAIGTMAATAAGAALGLGAYGLVIGNVAAELKKLKQLQQAAASGNKAAVQALNLYVKGLTPAFKEFINQLDATKKTYQAWGRSLEGPVLAPLTQGLKLVGPLLKQITPTVKIAAAAIGGLVDRLGKNITGGGFARFLAAMKPAIGPAITGFGIAIGHIVSGLGGILKAFAPFVPQFVHGLDSITAKFAKWGQTLTSHSGFQSLIGLWTKTGPQVNTIFKNLAAILVNVGKNMAGLATPANSAALINILTPLSSIIAKLSENQGLVKFVLYFLLLKSSVGQVTGPLKTASGTITGIYGAAAKAATTLGMFRDGFKDANAAASAFSGTAGTLGGKVSTVVTAIKGWAIWSKIASAATKIWTGLQWLWNAAMAANPIGLIIIAIAALVAVVIIAYKRFGWFRDFVHTVWDAIKTGAVDLWHALQAGWDAVWKAVVGVAKWFADRILGFFGILLHGAAAAFGWLPTIGDKLKAAAAAFDRFHQRVDKALSFHDKTVSVGVKLSPVGTGPFSGKQLAAGGRVPGWGGGDRWPALLEGGEAVVPKHLVPAVAPFLSANRVPGFAAGGLAGGGLTVQGAFPSVPAMAAAALAVVKHLAQRNIGSLFGGLGGGGTGVARWAGVILTALRLLRQSPGWLGLVERRMNQESGGNPTVVNRWDSNWAAGTPSVGLMQVIGPTFAAYAGPFRNTGPFLYGTSVNPLANTYAGLNYALHQYGTLAALGQPGGYDRGGILRPGLTLAYNGTGRDEYVTRFPGGPQRLEITGGQSEFERFMATFIRKFVRLNGGGDVQQAFGT